MTSPTGSQQGRRGACPGLPVDAPQGKDCKTCTWAKARGREPKGGLGRPDPDPDPHPPERRPYPWIAAAKLTAAAAAAGARGGAVCAAPSRRCGAGAIVSASLVRPLVRPLPNRARARRGRTGGRLPGPSRLSSWRSIAEPTSRDPGGPTRRPGATPTPPPDDGRAAPGSVRPPAFRNGLRGPGSPAAPRRFGAIRGLSDLQARSRSLRGLCGPGVPCRRSCRASRSFAVSLAVSAVLAAAS